MYTSHQFAIAQPLPVRANNDAVVQRQLLYSEVKTLCRLLQQPAARFGGGITQGYRRNLQGGTGDSRPLIWRAFSVAQHHAHLIHAQVKLFGDNLT
ncbi:hypothetical protein D3C78_1227170 [compost metagenome]